jgi:hypothetical protein
MPRIRKELPSAPTQPSTTSIPMVRPAPIIEKIELTQEDTEEIQSLMDGKPPKSKVAYWKEMGKEHFIKAL